jgi:hypothetical protein
MACLVFDTRSESSKHRPMTYMQNFPTATSFVSPLSVIIL